MASKGFEIHQLLKAYRKGFISDALFEAQTKELGAANGGLEVTLCVAGGRAPQVRGENMQGSLERLSVVRSRGVSPERLSACGGPGTEKGGQYALWLF